jgi:SAM-dependent methyltransferase
MSKLPVSLQSLIVQIVAALLAVSLGYFVSSPLAFQPWLWVAAQAAIAVLLSRAIRQPAWWTPLHAGFLPAVLLARMAHLPAGFYLAAFVLLLLFYWSCFRTRVPLFLSGRRARASLASVLPACGKFSFIDLGSGFGGVSLYLESRFPEAQLYGTEIAPAPWLLSRLRGWLRRSRVGFLRRDYQRLDLADYDAVFAFLSPAAMPALWQQANAQMRRGSVFISLAFGIEGRVPDQTITLAAGSRHTLHVWRM